MNERIKEFAEQAGLVWSRRDGWWIAYHDSNYLERFAELVRADEREAIIKILNGIDKEQTEAENGYWETSTGAEFGAWIIETIRARGNT